MNVGPGHQFLEHCGTFSTSKYFIKVQVGGTNYNLTVIWFLLNMDTSCTPNFAFAKAM